MMFIKNLFFVLNIGLYRPGTEGSSEKKVKKK